MNRDAELLVRVNSKKDFFGSVLSEDAFDDWNLAKEFGEFLVRILPEEEVMGHALLARAHRHLGNLELSRTELDACWERLRKRELEAWEARTLLPMLEQEEKLLSG